MEEAKGPVKHVLLAKFKDDVSPEKVEELINGYANLVNLIERMKAFHWGEDVSIENLHQGFTHIFESTFESKEAVAEYIAHPVHVALLAKCDICKRFKISTRGLWFGFHVTRTEGRVFRFATYRFYVCHLRVQGTNHYKKNQRRHKNIVS